MLREKLKRRLILRPLLLLAALFALSQSAWAWSNYYIQEENSGSLRIKMTWDSSDKQYTVTIPAGNKGKTVYVQGYQNDTDNKLYGRASGQTSNYWFVNDGNNAGENMSEGGKPFYIDTDKAIEFVMQTGQSQTGNPASFKYTAVNQVANKTYYVKVKRDTGTWTFTETKSITGAGTVTITKDNDNSSDLQFTKDKNFELYVSESSSSDGTKYQANTSGYNVNNNTEVTNIHVNGGSVYTWKGNTGKVSIQVTLDASGVPTSFKVIESTSDKTISGFLNYQATKGASSWSNSSTITRTGAGTLVMKATMQHESHFGIKIDNVWKGANSSDTEVTKDTQAITTFGGSHFIWMGGDGEVTVTATVDADGNITSATFNGPVYSTTPVDNNNKYYLGGTWAGPTWGDDLREFQGTGNTRTLSFNNFSADWKFKIVVNSDWSKQATGTGVKNTGSDNQLALDFKGTGTGTVTFTLTLDANGNPSGLSAVMSGFTMPVTAGMPFYPKGVYNDTQFQQAIAANKSYYYLVGHALNAEKESPEWQMTDEDGDGVYTLDFTYNIHDGNCQGKTSSDDNNNRYWVYVKKYTNAASTSSTTAHTGVRLVDDNNLKSVFKHHAAGYRIRAFFNPSANSLTFKGLVKKSDGSWEESTNSASELPFVSFIGANWKQPNDGKIAQDDKPVNPDNGAWQNAWIQYNEKGEAVKTRDGSKYYYNTQWPPQNPIYFNTKFTVDGKEYDLTLTSPELVFTNTGLGEMSYEQIKNAEPFKTYIEKQGLVLDQSKKYQIYSVNNVWANGSFKLWSGWNGARYDGTNAEWDSNWNWGHSNQQESGKQVSTKINTTYTLGKEEGDMCFTDKTVNSGTEIQNQQGSKPTFLGTAYFFYEVSDPNGRYQSRFYAVPAEGGAEILAKSNDNYSAGQFNPSVACKEAGKTVTHVKVTAYKSSNDAKVSTFVDTDCSGVDEDNFNDVFTGAGLNSTDAPTGFFNDGLEYTASGYYYYVMEVTFSGSDKVVSVKSNPFFISQVSGNVVASQLVEVKDNAQECADYKYVTYDAGKVFGVKVSGDKISAVEELENMPSSAFYSDQCTWTDKVLVYTETELPEGSTNLVWKVNGTETTSDLTGAKFATIVEGSVMGETYAITETFDNGENTGITNTIGSDKASLRIPTVRLVNGHTFNIIEDNDTHSVSVACEDYLGSVNPNKKGDDYAGGQSYNNVKLRGTSLKLQLEMPNATQELHNKFAGKVASVTFTQNGKTLVIGSLSVSNSSATSLGLNNINLDEYIDPSNGEAITHTFTVKETGDVALYPRTDSSIDVKLTPIFTAPQFESKSYAYCYKYQPNKNVNMWREKGILVRMPDFQSYGKNIISGSEINLVKQNSFYSVKLESQTIGNSGCDGKVATNHLHEHDIMKRDDAEAPTYQIYDVEVGTWWAGMDKITYGPKSYRLQAAHALFFRRNYSVTSVDGALTLPANAPMRADDNGAYAYVPVYAGGGGSNELEIQTAVDAIETDGGQFVVVGQGFMDLTVEGTVFAADGRKVYQGEGRINVAPGVYVVTTGTQSVKVMVR